MIISPRIQGGGLLFIPQGATPCTPPSLSSYKLSLLGVKKLRWINHSYPQQYRIELLILLIHTPSISIIDSIPNLYNISTYSLPLQLTTYLQHFTQHNYLLTCQHLGLIPTAICETILLQAVRMRHGRFYAYRTWARLPRTALMVHTQPVKRNTLLTCIPCICARAQTDEGAARPKQRIQTP